MSVEEPLFRIVRGVPTVEELAALVGAIAVRSRPAVRPTPAPASVWARSGRPVGAALTPGVAAWRSSGLPR
ncbi:acyl-CoA carboxylase subunit epsilon [Micromonospora sp. NPDC049891]|uniref:acyl-CoA carboxylase subunit epsilon n=1 Tax=Micromonospora sp. NPDC049891 TaxID=3155655 RepID=UPI0033FCA3CA